MSGTESQCDGPVNRFTVISRASQIAYSQTFDADTVAEALADAIDWLDENGDLSTNEFGGRHAL